jgi:ElaB/YqjD/DUF883 family membrane-anchored ribosome-binding protein
MANEDMTGGSEGQEMVHNKGIHGQEAWHTAEDLKSTGATVAKDYTEKAGAALDEAKMRVRTLREDSEDYLGKNPMKAVFTALGVGFMLGIIFKR